MYKVFFNDRTIFLTDEFGKNFQVKYGLFYKYRSVEDLKELISFYGKLRRIDSLYIFHHDIDVLRESFRNCFKNIDAAGGLVRNKDGKYLFIFRRGKWDLPKGKVNKNESFQKAAIREVQEECGLKKIEITIPLLNTYHTYILEGNLVLKKTYWFEMRNKGDDSLIPQTEEDITGIKWFGREETQEIIDNTYKSVIDVMRYVSLAKL